MPEFLLFVALAILGSALIDLVVWLSTGRGKLKITYTMGQWPEHLKRRPSTLYRVPLSDPQLTEILEAQKASNEHRKAPLGL